MVGARSRFKLSGMQHSNTSRASTLALATIVAATTLGGCAHDPESDGELESRLLVRITTPDDLTVEVREAESGAILVSEYGAIDTPSALAFLVGEYDATPLEVVLALTEDASSPPRAVVAEDEEFAERLAGDEPPRRLQLPAAQFRSLFPSYGNADCTFAQDHAWYVDLADDLGWDWRWYWYGPLPGNASGNQKSTATANDTDNFFSHLCAYSGDPVDHHLYDAGSVEWSRVDVTPGHRSTIWTSGVMDDWRAQAAKTAAETAGIKLGGLAP